MILRIMHLENEIILSEDFISTLLIYDKKLFRNVVTSFYNGSNGKDADEDFEIILLDKEKSLSVRKDILCIVDILNFEFNQKKILDSVYRYIEQQISMDYEQLRNFQNKMEEVYLEFQEVLEDLPFEMVMKEASGITDFLKTFSVKVNLDLYNNIVDRIYLIIDIVEYLKITQILIFVNINLYLEESELKELHKYIMYKKIKVLFIEQGDERKCQENEKIWYVDSDYDEFILYNK